jgi:hypothetical protein
MFRDNRKFKPIVPEPSEKDLGDGFILVPGNYGVTRTAEEMIAAWLKRDNSYEYKIFVSPGYHPEYRKNNPHRKPHWVIGRRKCRESMLV